MSTPTLIAGTTVTFQATLDKGDPSWTLVGATVNLYLRDPAGNVTTHPATVVDATQRVVQYVTLTTDLTAPTSGRPVTWRGAWEVLQGATVLRSGPLGFVVISSP